ncbi:MAG: TatD family hydrolase [Bacteroidota bacterium]
MIDTHAHIYASEFEEDFSEVIARSKAAGVEKILMPNLDIDSIDRVLKVASTYPDLCHPMVGLHPCEVKDDFEVQLAKLENHLSNPDFVAIGEIGTDLYWDKTFWKEQQKAFIQQCEWAVNLDLPVVIHCRDSIDETIELVSQFSSKGLTGVFHCFTGTYLQGKKIVDMGFYLGIGGVVTFKNSGLDQTVEKLPLDKILLETDAPYLAPVPNRGKRNEPAFLQSIVSKLSNLLSVAAEDIIAKTTSNALKLFTKIK